jgi:hypothetical protein
LEAKVCVPNSGYPQVELHRLSNQEYIFTIQDLFGVTLETINFPAGDEAGQSGFNNDYKRANSDSLLSDNIVSAYFTLAFSTAENIMTNRPPKELQQGIN